MSDPREIPAAGKAAPPCPSWCTSSHVYDGDGLYVHSATLGRFLHREGRAEVLVVVYRTDTANADIRQAGVSVGHHYYGADAVDHPRLPDLTAGQARTLALVSESTGGSAEFAAALRKAADILDQDGDGTEAGEVR